MRKEIEEKLNEIVDNVSNIQDRLNIKCHEADVSIDTKLIILAINSLAMTQVGLITTLIESQDKS